MNKSIINGIDVSKYFVNHYDDSGKLYAVEYKGNPLELQNAIKCLQKENEELKAENEQLKKPCLVMPKVNQLAVPIENYEKLYKALDEIKTYINQECENKQCTQTCANCFMGNVLIKVKEALNDRN